MIVCISINRHSINNKKKNDNKLVIVIVVIVTESRNLVVAPARLRVRGVLPLGLSPEANLRNKMSYNVT